MLTIDPSVLKQSRLLLNSGPYKVGDSVAVHVSLPKERVDQATRRPTVEIEYVLRDTRLDNQKQIGRQMEDWSAATDAGGGLTVSRVLDTRALPAGIYELQIRIRDQVSRQQASVKNGFLIVE